MTTGERIQICHRCEHRAQRCNGPCPCLVDGADIIDHATKASCPLGKFSEPEAPATAAGSIGEPAKQEALIPLPGDLIEAVAKRIGLDRLAKFWERRTGKPCGCAERKEKINRTTERLLRWLGK